MLLVLGLNVLPTFHCEYFIGVDLVCDHFVLCELIVCVKDASNNAEVLLEEDQLGSLLVLIDINFSYVHYLTGELCNRSALVHPEANMEWLVF